MGLTLGNKVSIGKVLLWALLNPLEYLQYAQRVDADSGIIESTPNTLKVVRGLKQIYGSLNNFKIILLKDGGFKKRNLGIFQTVLKWYDLSQNNNDAVPLAEEREPYINGSGAENPNTNFRYLVHPAIAFTESQPFSFTVVVNSNGGNDGLNILFGDSEGNCYFANNIGGNLFAIKPSSGAAAIGGIPNAHTIGLNAIIQVIVDATHAHIYLNNVLHESLAINGTFNFTSIIKGYANNTPEYLFKGKYLYHSLLLGNPTEQQRSAEYDLLRGVIKPIETTTIDTAKWDKKNLDIVVTPLGYAIPYVADDAAWALLDSPAWCYYKTDVNGSKFGKLYNGFAVEKIQEDINTFNAANPTKRINRRVAVSTEWQMLRHKYGGTAQAGGALKATGTSVWYEPNAGATNESGLSVYGGGSRNADGSFASILGGYGRFWAADNQFFELVYADASLASSGFGADKRLGFSVRMIEDYAIEGNVLVLGDSTVAEYLTERSIMSFIPVNGTLTDLSVSGATIDAQLTAYNALSEGVKSGVKYAFVQLGINSMSDIEAAYTSYQTLINTIATNSPSATIVGATMIPCRAGVGEVQYAKWLLLNESIRGDGANAITGIDIVCDSHTVALNNGTDSLLPQYSLGDGIHDNNAGRKVNAEAWKAAIA